MGWPCPSVGEISRNYNLQTLILETDRLRTQDLRKFRLLHELSREIGRDASASIAYVGSKATHARRAINPQKSLSPGYLSLGSALNSTFPVGSNTLTLNGTSYNTPYAGWSAQMQGCSPTLAQSLLPYPQFCSNLVEPLESSGYATYHSLQLSAIKRYTKGPYVLTNSHGRSYSARRLRK